MNLLLIWIRSLKAPTDPIVEGADFPLVCGEEADEKLFARLAKPGEILGHAAAGVEEHDDADRLHGVVEHDERLRFVVVEDRKISFDEAGDQPFLRVGHRRKKRDDRRPGLEGWLLRGQRQGAEGGCHGAEPDHEDKQNAA